VVYRQHESSFDFVPDEVAGVLRPVGASGSLVIGMIEIGVSLPSGLLTYARGYSPRSSWVPMQGSPGDCADGVVIVDDDRVQEGLAIGVHSDDSDVWWTQFDADSGWFQATNGTHSDALTRIASDTVIGTSSAGISSLWLRPTFID
jgi:hypothetical protein